MSAQPMTINFTNVQDLRQHPTGNSQEDFAKRKPISAEGKLLTPKQIRARARRKNKRNQTLTQQEMEHLYNKPIEEWDLDELAHGRPRNARGHFKGPKPQWITTAVHEKAMELYTSAIKTGMRSMTVDVMGVMKDLIINDDVDEKGKPIVPAGVKADLGKFFIEHVVGKPTQRVENDVSVRLQAILGHVLVNPADMAQQSKNFVPGHFPGVTMELAAGDMDDDDLPGE